MFTSVFNDVLGPVMRGPSSSHTAGSYHIGLMVRDLLGVEPTQIKIFFDHNGSYSQTYKQQGVDLAFVTGLMGWKQTDEIFKNALEVATKKGVEISFGVLEIPQADHPNYVILEISGANGEQVKVEAKSVGGGTFKIVTLNGNDVSFDGKKYETILLSASDISDSCLESIKKGLSLDAAQSLEIKSDQYNIYLSTSSPISEDLVRGITSYSSFISANPVYYTQQNRAPFSSASSMQNFAEENGFTLGQAVLEYEKTVLGLSEKETIDEMLRRYEVMKASVIDGLSNEKVDMLLLEPVANKIMTSVKQKKVAIGGLHSKASAAAMAAMHTCNSRGVVCAAPTGGAAGTLPGILTAMEEEFNIDDQKLALMMFAAGGIGLILAIRSTFAAEVAGCQVEIGAAGAMGAAAVIEFADGTPLQACDAAAISFQNTMGSVCDLVQGMCEIPCHTRNGVAASSAFTNADMILGGYYNPVPLDETIDSVHSSGLMLPSELRCTAKGGLALAPSALNLRRSSMKC